MNKPSKCKNCQWYGKPYWSIINPCDNCPMENVETFTRWYDPTIEERDKEIDRLNNIIKEAKEKLQSIAIFGLRSGKTLLSSLLNDVVDILDKADNDEREAELQNALIGQDKEDEEE